MGWGRERRRLTSSLRKEKKAVAGEENKKDRRAFRGILSERKKGSGVTRSREAEALVVLWIHRSPTADLVPDEPQIWRDANDVADLARVVKARWANRHFVLRIARRLTFAPYLLGEALGVDDEALMGPATDHVHPVAHLHLEHEAPAVYFDELHSGGYLKTGRCRRLVTHIPSAPRLYRRQSTVRL